MSQVINNQFNQKDYIVTTLNYITPLAASIYASPTF